MAAGDVFGTEPGRLARHGSPDTSVHAAYKVDTTRLERMVHQAILSFGDAGCISDEVRAMSMFEGFSYSSVTARYGSLIDKGLVIDTGKRKPGKSGRMQRVMRAVPAVG